MSNKEYLTVSEVATIVEITTQAVYKQLHNQLQPFVVKVGNKTMLKKSVITEFYNKELPTNTTKVTNQSYQPICQLKPTQANSLVEVLNEQLNSKDQQIKDLLLKQDNLQVELYKQNEHNRQQADKLIALIEQVNELQKNNQILLAQNNKKQLENKVAEVPGEQIKEKTNFFKKVFNKWRLEKVVIIMTMVELIEKLKVDKRVENKIVESLLFQIENISIVLIITNGCENFENLFVNLTSTLSGIRFALHEYFFGLCYLDKYITSEEFHSIIKELDCLQREKEEELKQFKLKIIWNKYINKILNALYSIYLKTGRTITNIDFEVHYQSKKQLDGQADFGGDNYK